MQVSLVHPAQVAGVWPSVREFILAAMAGAWREFYGEWDVEKALIDGRWSLYVAHDEDGGIHAAVVLYPVDYPRCRVVEVPFIGGRRMREWLKPMQEAIERHAKAAGAVATIGFGREGWCRVAGYRESGKVFRKELR